METIKKTELVTSIQQKLGITNKLATEMVNALVDEMANALSEGTVIDLAGLGKFEVKERKSRKGINPVTKERIEIPATKSIKFKPTSKLKRKINE